MDPQSLRHLHALRDFVRNLVEQAERSEGCECHRPPSLLLVGPPGAGKTYLVKQMSNVCDMPLFGVHTHQLSGPLSLRNLFLQARDLDYPSLFFLDDIDYIFSDQDANPPHDSLTEALRSELYKQLGPRKLKIFDKDSARNPVHHSLPASPSPKSDSGFHDEDNYPDNNGLILVAATSSPWLLYKDHELLSRFRGVYLVGLPDRETRYHMLKVLLQKVQHNLTEKDLWIIADKTEGYTPSDLMVITKALNYEQFSLLFSMAGLGAYGDEGSSNDATSMCSSDDMTESETDSNYDPESGEGVTHASSSFGDLQTLKVGARSGRGVGSSEVPNAAAEGLFARRLGATIPDKSGRADPQSHSAASRGSPLSHSDHSRNHAEKSTDSSPETLEELERDWSSDEDSQSGSIAQEDTSVVTAPAPPAKEKVSQESDERSEKTEETSAVSHEEAASVTGDVGEDVPDHKSLETTPENNEGSRPVLPDRRNPRICDNSDSDSETNVNGEIPLSETESRLPPTDKSPDDAGRASPASDTKGVAATATDSDNETREFELRVSEPPDPFPDDNKAVDSGSDSDNENNNNNNNNNSGSAFSSRNRRVNFGNVSSMHPLSIEVDDLDNNEPSNNGYDYDSNSNNLSVEDLIPKGAFLGPSSNSILKKLLEPSDDNSDNDNSNDKISNDRENESNKENSEDDYRNVFGRSSPGNDGARASRSRRARQKTPDSSMFASIPTMSRSSSSSNNSKSSRGNSTPSRERTTPPISPAPSVNSATLSSGGDTTDSGSGRSVRLRSTGSDNEINKATDSNSSLYGKSETNTTPSSESSSATCNVSGETLECRSDSDERLRNVDEDLKGRRRSPGSPPAASDDEESGDENDALRTILKLNNLGEVSIKILTLTDVLNVIDRTPRSVTDEEIKRYTDFMVWFANVAKSACPHSSKGVVSDSVSSMDAESVDGSLWNSSTATHKKRKGPFKKLGRFLLKALMFILD